MKNILLLILMMTGCIHFNAVGMDNRKQSIFLSYDRDIIPKDKEGHTRGIPSQTISAYICDGSVFVLFYDSFPIVSIRILYKDMEEVVYWEDYANPSVIEINMDGESHGEYIIEIVIDDERMKGMFNL